MERRKELGRYDEKYPGYVCEGREAYTLSRALEMKAQKEAEMQRSPRVVNVQVQVLPLKGMHAKKEQYYVHNTSTYEKF